MRRQRPILRFVERNRRFELQQAARYCLLFSVVFYLQVQALSQLAAPAQNWKFAVSGNSRNCGDIVMPAIAKQVQEEGAMFYWHLGDFRSIYTMDEDFVQGHGPFVTNAEYYQEAWGDFIQNQLLSFGSIPVFLAKGRHEAIPPKTNEDYLAQFADWLSTDPIRNQKLKDDPNDRILRTYYHWINDGIDFITLDNSRPTDFDDNQLTWVMRVLDHDAIDPRVKSIVVAMHSALPDGLDDEHSMADSPRGLFSGRQVYEALVKLRNQKRVNIYVLTSNSPFFIQDAFDSKHLQFLGGVLPGWIIGTAGSVRYRLPDISAKANQALTDVYGYLLGTVSPNGQVDFEFRKISEEDVPRQVVERYSHDFVHKICFANNKVTFRPD